MAGRRNERSSEHGRKEEKKEMKKRIAACIAMIWAVQPMTAFAEEEDLEVYSGIPFETVIAQPERVDQWLVYLNGVLKIEEEGWCCIIQSRIMCMIRGKMRSGFGKRGLPHRSSFWRIILVRG